MQSVLDALNACCGWDCVVKSYDGWRLCLSSGSSTAYTRPLAVFVGVSYLSLPMEFSHPGFRKAGPTEIEHVSRVVPIDEGDTLFAIDAETMAGLDRQTFYVLASSVEQER